MIDFQKYDEISSELKRFDASLVAVSKMKPAEDIRSLFEYGHKQFGENYVQELIEKSKIVDGPEWHYIGHLQTNKAKLIVPHCSLIHGMDSVKILKSVDKQAGKLGIVQSCLLQIHIAKEETKFGFTFEEAEELLKSAELMNLKNIKIKGFMGMATATDEIRQISSEFRSLNNFFMRFKGEDISVLSMGMTNDYRIALNEGSNMVRIGSAIFGDR